VKSAVLLKSVRTAAGPRQRHICYLGSIREGHEGQIGHRIGFWEAAHKGLDGAGIEGDERARIVAALESVVLGFSAKDWAELKVRRAEAEARIAAKERRG
jgi:hypothetical protein